MSRLRRPAVAFSAVAAVFGTLFALILPAFAGYDEPLHFLRAWQVSDGGVFAREVTDANGTRDLGGDVPVTLVADIRALLREGVFERDAAITFKHLDDRAPRGEHEFIGFAGAAVYSPVPYAPSAVAIRIARTLHLSTLATLLLARFATVASFVALVALAIRRLPARRWMLAVLGLLPVAVYQTGTVTADSLTVALAILLVADALRLTATERADIRSALLVETAAVTVALALAKQPAFALVALLAIPMWRHRGRVAASLGAAAGAGAALAIVWSRWAEQRYVAPEYLPDFDGSYAYRDVDPDRQLEYVREHPFDFVHTIGTTFGKWGRDIAHDTLGQLAWWRPSWLLLACVAIVVVAVFVDAAPLPSGRAFMLLGIGVAAVVTLVTLLLAYVGWNQVGAPRIDAFQGRYLYAAFVMLVLLAPPPVTRRSAGEVDGIGLRLVAGQAVVLAIVAFGLARVFYL